jgi:hypothetical protein
MTIATEPPPTGPRVTRHESGDRREHSNLSWTARRWARRVSDATTELTGPARMRPDFLIVGAQRCGTTTMFKALVQHPQVVRPFLRKGIHYFDKRYDRGERWYRGHFPLTATAQVTSRRLGGLPVLTGESSPYYMFHPLAPQRIAGELPGVKLVVLLRDPVIRAYSAHSHERGRGFEDLDFADAVAAEPERIAGERERLMAEPGSDSLHWQHHAYLTRGQYVEQLRVLEQAVGRERLCVVDSGRLFSDPRPVVDEVVAFLGLEPADDLSLEQHNARSRSPLPDDLRTRLERHFEPYDEQLAAWWGRTPSRRE